MNLQVKAAAAPPGIRVAQIDQSQLAGELNEQGFAVLEALLSANPGPAAQFRAGKEQTFAFLVGQAMKQSRGRAHPEKLQVALRAVLTEES